MKFEYLIGRVAGPDLVEVQTRLDKFGRDGWELVSIELTQVPRNQVERQDTSGIFIFKRCIIPPELAAGIRRDFIFPECERCWQWDREIGGCTENVIKGESSEERCANWTFSKPAEPAEDPENEQARPGARQTIWPLFLGDVAVCTGGHCEQFNIAKYECELAGPTGSGAVCSVWYKRKGEVAPCGTAEFVLSRVLLNPGSENNWEPLVKKVEEAMDDFAHYESHSTRTEARRAVVEIILRAVEDVDGGFRVLKRFSKGSLP